MSSDIRRDKQHFNHSLLELRAGDFAQISKLQLFRQAMRRCA
jgi:hypothetical protein